MNVNDLHFKCEDCILECEERSVKLILSLRLLEIIPVFRPFFFIKICFHLVLNLGCVNWQSLIDLSYVKISRYVHIQQGH